MDELINNLNLEDLVIDNSNIINTDNCSIELPGIGRRAYINSAKGRSDLKTDCEQSNSPEVYSAVMEVWGDAPTVEDEIIPKPTFDELKTAKIDELSAAFSARTRGAFTTTQGYIMQFDTSDSLKMQGAIQLMEAVGQAEGYLTQANDATVYHVPIATMRAVLVEMLAAYAQCHARKQELRAQINEAQNVEELNAIELTWPV